MLFPSTATIALKLRAATSVRLASIRIDFIAIAYSTSAVEHLHQRCNNQTVECKQCTLKYNEI